MSADYFMYRIGIGKKKQYTIPFKNNTTLQWVRLIFNGAIDYSIYDEDYFISICQYLMQEGYKMPFNYTGNNSEIQKFYQDALFSVSPFLFDECSRAGFSLSKFREQFDLMGESKIRIPSYYRRREAMPIPLGMSVDKMKNLIFKGRNFYNRDIDRFKHSYNEYHPEAVFILERSMSIEKDRFVYSIDYSYESEKQLHLQGRACSYWNIKIESKENENYADFLIRLYDNYENILSGEKIVRMEKYFNQRYQLL